MEKPSGKSNPPQEQASNQTKTDSDQQEATESLIKGKIVLYEDKPIRNFDQDKLNFKDSVQVVSHVFRNIQPPLTFGIYGDWGSGRTSFMNLLMKDLAEEEKFKIVGFNAWSFKKENNLVFPLLRTIQKELNITESFFVDAKKTALLSRVSFQQLTEILFPFDQYKMQHEGEEKTEVSYDEEFLTHYDLWVDQIQSLKKRLKRIIQGKLKEQNKETMVLFIDNLDLCPPEISIGLLEFIYNFLNNASCINVIAVDQNQTAKNIKTIHANLKLSQSFRYLERIIPYSFSIPVMTDNKLRSYILKSIKEIISDEEDIQKWDSLKRKIDKLLTIFLEKEQENPKKIIKELNIFTLVFKLKANQLPSLPMALFLIILKNFYPEVFKFILNYTGKGLVDLKSVFDEKSETMTVTGFQIRYGKQLSAYLQDFPLKNLMNSFNFAERDWPLIEDYLNVVSFLSANF